MPRLARKDRPGRQGQARRGAAALVPALCAGAATWAASTTWCGAWPQHLRRGLPSPLEHGRGRQLVGGQRQAGWRQQRRAETQQRASSSEEEAAAVELLAALREGGCSTDSLPTLDLRLLPPSEERPLSGLRCPALILGAFERCGLGAEAERWTNWEEFSRAAGGDGQTVYDKNAGSNVFTYWDNMTALTNAVRGQGVAAQVYTKETSSSGDFLKACAEGSGEGTVRYGSEVGGLAPSLARELGLEPGGAGRLAPIAPDTADHLTYHLWASSPQVMSTAHFDPGWENGHFVISGGKDIALAPLSFETTRVLQIRPGMHPHNRQSRLSLFDESFRKGSGVVEGILVAHLPPGTGVFIPAGWLHELRAHDDLPTAAIGLVGHGPEMQAYTNLIAPKEKLLAPFFNVPYFREELVPERFSAVLAAFFPKLLAGLQLDERLVRDVLLARYGEATRREAGFPLAGQGSWPPELGRRLGELRPQDWAAIDMAANYWAAGFAPFRRELLPHYLPLFLEVLLSKACPGANEVEILGNMLGLIEALGEAPAAERGGAPQQEVAA